MLVHICITHPDLREMQDQVAAELRDAGDEVVVVDDLYPASPSARREITDAVQQADAMVCLLGPADRLRSDGTIPGEWEVEAALGAGVALRAYDASDTDLDLDGVTGRAGYVHARRVRLASQIHYQVAVPHVADIGSVQMRTTEDLARVRARQRTVAPAPFRELHRRLRSHPDPRYDMFALSMQNTDSLYRVDEIKPNSEVPTELIGRWPGGAGANSAVALSRLGLVTTVAGVIGNDSRGSRVRTDLDDNDVDTSLLLRVDDAETGRDIVIHDRHGRYVKLANGGANGRVAAEFRRQGVADAAIQMVRRSRIVHYTSFTNAAGHDYQEQLLTHVRPETVVSFKPSTMQAEYGADRLEVILGRCDVLVISEHELDLLFDRSPDYRGATSLSERLDALYAWRHRRGYTTPMVVVIYLSLGDPAQRNLVVIGWGVETLDGSYGHDRMHPPDGYTLRDATGMRDAAAAGVLYGLLRGRTPVECANLAFVLAMAVGGQDGCRAGLPPTAAVRDIWRAWLRVPEAPRWLDPYGYGSNGASAYLPMTV